MEKQSFSPPSPLSIYQSQVRDYERKLLVDKENELNINSESSLCRELSKLSLALLSNLKK
jgi:hypothetical protein